jgi:hypothetical protein
MCRDLNKLVQLRKKALSTEDRTSLSKIVNTAGEYDPSMEGKVDFR